jgi:CheY-like chemotaxis protein
VARGYNEEPLQAHSTVGFLRMAHRCALIVDDSRTARQALAAMLTANDLRVETAASAEEALEFLSRSRPDVIFMDHLMPGMDGLQAVRAIKANPATATIPIMMYTSQEGELYVGQARALGAVGVLPKQIKPVEVSEVLRSLHLTGGGEPGPAPAQAPLEHAPYVERRRDRDVTAALNSRDWTDMHRWLQEMFEHYEGEIRADIEKAITRAMREQAPVAVVAAPRSTVLPTLAVLALAAIAGVFFWLHLDTQEKWRAAVAQNAGLMSALNARRELASAAATTTVRQLDAERDEVSGRFGEFVTALEWGVNQSAVYPPGAEPFGTQRLETLRGLLDRLGTLGFTGTVRLDSHVGDFCYATGPDDKLAIAADDLPAERCDRIGLSAEEARAASARQSVAFANFLSTRSGDRAVRIEVSPHGNAQPAVPYPPGPEGITAGEWNVVARQNNRVDVTLIPDSP